MYFCKINFIYKPKNHMNFYWANVDRWRHIARSDYIRLVIERRAKQLTRAYRTDHLAQYFCCCSVDRIILFLCLICFELVLYGIIFLEKWRVRLRIITRWSSAAWWVWLFKNFVDFFEKIYFYCWKWVFKPYI